MKEAEFRALLAIEGRELEVESSYFRRWDLSDREYMRHTAARVIERHPTDPHAVTMIMGTNWVQRRDYAIKSLAKRYYRDRG